MYSYKAYVVMNNGNIFGESHFGHASVALERSDGAVHVFGNHDDAQHTALGRGEVMLEFEGTHDGFQTWLNETSDDIGSRMSADITIRQDQYDAMFRYALGHVGESDYSFIGDNCADFVNRMLGVGEIGENPHTLFDQAALDDFEQSSPDVVDYISLAYASDREVLGWKGDNYDGGVAGDVVLSGSGDDTVDGHWGDDQLYGESGNDQLDGGAGRDVLIGGRDDDTLLGGWGDDYLDGGRDNDSLVGGFGDDELVGGSGNDTLRGGMGSDVLSGGSGGDTLSGGLGDDLIVGGSGRDSLVGWLGNDTLIGGGGGDTMRGGWGADHFVLQDDGDAPTGLHHDIILDFSDFGGDKLDMTAIRADHGLSVEDFLDGLSVAKDTDGVNVTEDWNGDGHTDFMVQLLGSHDTGYQDWLLY